MYKITIAGDRATLSGKTSSRLVAILPSLEGRRRWTNGGLDFEATRHNISLLETSLGAKVVSKGAMAEEFEAYRPTTKSIKRAPRKTEPMPHQLQALNHFGDKPVMALFMEQGTGKTKTDIDWCDDLYLSGSITGHIVVSRKGVHRQWVVQEYPKHSSSDWSGAYWDKDRIPPLPSNGLQVISINWDGIKTPKGWEWVEEFAKRHKGRLLITADEAQDMKNPRSERHKAMMRLKPYSSHRALTTGTPIAKDLTDEWAILKWLDENILGVKYLTTFRAQYCIMGGFQNRSVVGHKELERFRALTAPFVFRVRKTDIGLLPKQYDDWTFSMSPIQKQMIAELRQEAKLMIGGKEIFNNASAATILGKVQQISNGFLMDEAGDAIRIMPVDKNPRVLSALEWFTGSDSKAIIWCKYREDIAIVQEAFAKYAPAVYMGGVKERDRAAVVEGFLDPDGPPIMLATDAASTGLNLQGSCNRALYYSEGYNAINRWQKEDRIDRIGTIGFTVHTDLIAIGSADRSIHRNRLKKKGISDMAIEGLGSGGSTKFNPAQGPDAMEILLSFAQE